MKQGSWKRWGLCIPCKGAQSRSYSHGGEVGVGDGEKVLNECSGKLGFREHSNEVTPVAGEKELDICWWGKGGASCISVCRKSHPAPFSTPLAPYPLSPSPHLSNTTSLAWGRARVPASSVVLSETVRIVSKLTHTTNVREPCHTALGSASCCLRGRRRGRRSPAGASGSALGAGGRGGAGVGSTPSARRPRPFFAPSPADRNDLEVQESHVTSPGG